MKQLKVIANNYDNNNGIINVTFNQEIVVPPNSSISMDKFTMEVTNGITDNFIISPQTVFLNTAIYKNQPYQATIRGGKYTNIQALLTEMTRAFNAILDTSLTFTQVVTVSGFMFYNYYDTTTNLVHLAWGSIAPDVSSTNYTKVNMDFTPATMTPSEWVAAAAGDYSTLTTLPVIQGGLDIQFGLTLADITDHNTFEYGLYDTTGALAFGIAKRGEDFFSVAGASATPIDSAAFVNHPNYKHQFYVQGGRLNYQILDAGNNLILQIFNFAGYSQAADYNFGIKGNFDGTGDAAIWTGLSVTFQPNITSDTFGIHWDLPSFTSPSYIRLSSVAPVPPSRRVEYDFTGASNLQDGIGFPQTIFDSPDSPAISGDVAATNKPSFQDYYDLCLQCPNLQIESYLATTDRLNGGRVNNLCYFVPAPTSSTNKLIYTYEQRELLFVTLANKETVNMNTLQFRVVYSENNNQWVLCDKLSFNLYIQEPPAL